MKHIKTVIGLALLTLAFTINAQTYQQAQGLYIDGSTNTITLTSTNPPVALVVAGENRFFNLTGVNGQQDLTNLWPTMSFTTGRGQGSGYSTLGIHIQFNTAASKQSNLVFQIATSMDGVNWCTNTPPYRFSIAQANANIATFETNIFPCPPFAALWNIDARNCDATSSNLLIKASLKP